MIARERIIELVKGKLNGNMFLVDVMVNPSNVIHIEVDNHDGLTIDQCAELNRYIESQLDRNAEDFELQVSSPGIGHYFKVNEQFRRNVGRELEIITAGNNLYQGRLNDAGESGIVLEVTTREKQEGERKPRLVTKMVSFDYADIKKARVIISFK
jgi:ribosome maturation factor RimP